MCNVDTRKRKGVPDDRGNLHRVEGLRDFVLVIVVIKLLEAVVISVSVVKRRLMYCGASGGKKQQQQYQLDSHTFFFPFFLK
jgi:hypothetical protein